MFFIFETVHTHVTLQENFIFYFPNGRYIGCLSLNYATNKNKILKLRYEYYKKHSKNIYNSPNNKECQSYWQRDLRRRSAAARLLRSWVRIPPGAWMSVLSFVCCQVQVSATSWSLVQRRPTDCVASLRVIKKNLKNEEAIARVGLQRQKKRN